MTYEQAREFIDNSNKYGSKLGLVTISELLKRLDSPQDKLKVIHIAGTNGKGSTAAYISSILTTQGYRVGRYVSPAVFSYRERIQINSEYITEEGISETIGTIKPICEAMVMDGFSHPTSFEIETAMAFLYLVREQVDFAIIEVGMGGRLDATNVIKHPICSVITSVSMDHMQFLGDSLEKIASEKAGIIKQGSSVITGNTKPEVYKVIKQVCDERESRLITASGRISDTVFSPEATSFSYESQNSCSGKQDSCYVNQDSCSGNQDSCYVNQNSCYGNQNFTIKLLGKYQIDNAILTIETARELCRLGYRISDSSIKNGLQNATWSGRLEIISRNPYLIIDGAHNEDAAIQLRDAMQTIFPHKRMIFIMGVLADKEYRKILKITAPLASVIITITPDNVRALDGEILAEEARHFTEREIINAVSVREAVSFAYEKAGKEDVILAFGSLSFLGEITKII